MGSGITRSPLGSATPPCSRIATIERTKCWLSPMRPVTPYITMPSLRVAMRALLPSAICGRDKCILSTCKTTAPRLFWPKECQSGALRVRRSIGQYYGGYATVLTRSQQRHTVAACFLSWTLDAFDFFIMVFVLADIAKEFGTGMTAVTIAITLTLAARPLGALLFGYMADSIGRRLC